MARGEKLDLEIGADFGDGWNMVEEENGAAVTETVAPKAHKLVFKMEKRRGKAVTLCGPFSLAKNDLADLLKRIKKRLGCGGAAKAEWLEFQGDIAPKLRELLRAEGFGLKR